MFKSFLKITFTVILLYIIYQLIFIVHYYFSDQWKSNKEVLVLKQQAKQGDCNASFELFRHYHKLGIIYTSDANKWFLFSFSEQCTKATKREKLW